MVHVAIELDEDERSSFRRLLVVSALLHLAGIVALAWVPSLPSLSPPSAIAVNLVAAPSLSAPPPAPAPAPAVARPAPKPPKPAPVVLPKEPTLPKPTTRAKPEPKPKPKPKPRPEPPPEVEPAPEHDYADVMASLREELGEESAPEPVVEAAAPAPSGGAPGGRTVSPELRAWMIAARIRIKNNWVVPASFRMASIAAEVRIEVDATGGVVGEPELVASSGNPFYDEGVLRSIRKASPLPPPPEAGEWTFRFLSDEF